jgi:putative phage-type endonuclease
MIVQGSEEWHQLRCGKATASRIADIMAQGQGKTRASYMRQLLAERLTGLPTVGFKSASMDRGNIAESGAREAYEYHTGLFVEQVAFVDHPRIAMSGASPDGLVTSEGGVEIKCPDSTTHIDTLQGASIDGGYLKQMQWNMACTQRQWWDYVSFDARMKDPAMRLFIKRVRRDDAMITAIEIAVITFLAELDAKVSELTSRYGSGLELAA